MQIFFYYCFTNKRWYDQICRNHQSIGKPWDLIESNGSHFLLLGSDISWYTFYHKPDYYFELGEYSFICSLMRDKTLVLIHWMVYQYYTSYRAIVWLFIANLSAYLKHTLKIKTYKKKDLIQHSSFNTLWWSNDTLTSLQKITLDKSSFFSWQTLVVFPDSMSIAMRSHEKEYILTGRDTSSRVMNYYVDIQYGYKNIILTTAANMFMDYRLLDQIIFYFPNTRYYKYQHDPRISVSEVIDKLVEIWWAKKIIVQ